MPEVTGETPTSGGARISVVIPVFNGARYIAQAIASVQEQDYPDIEVIVVDDGSTDDTADVVKRIRPKVHYSLQENGGSGAARNHGARKSTGEFIAFLDADDLWTGNKLALQIAAFEQMPELDVVWGHVKEFRDGEIPRSNSGGRPIGGQHPGAALFRTEAFQRTGGFSSGFRNTEVVEWVSRVTATGLRQLMLPDVVMFRRLHEDNKGRENPEAHREYLHVLKRHLDRKRS